MSKNKTQNNIKRYFKIPEDINLMDLATKKPMLIRDESDIEDPVHPWILDFRTFMIRTILGDPRFGKTLSDVLTASSILKSIDDALASDNRIVCLNDNDYKLVIEVLQEPTIPYRPEVTMQCGSFFEVLQNASTNNPEEIS